MFSQIFRQIRWQKFFHVSVSDYVWCSQRPASECRTIVLSRAPATVNVIHMKVCALMSFHEFFFRAKIIISKFEKFTNFPLQIISEFDWMCFHEFLLSRDANKNKQANDLNEHMNIFPTVFELQVNLCQKHSFLNQLTHNMTTDCS